MVVRAIWRQWPRPLPTLGFLGLLALAFCWGRFGSLPRAGAVPPAAPPPAGAAGAPADTNSDYARRWVAVLYGNIPITREEFGEYLIARHSEQLELLVNKRIIELACKQRGIEVTAAEVDAALVEDLKSLKVSQKDFVTKILKHYNKSLFEWKEDVIRPKLALSKLCRNRIKVTDQDLQDAFQAYYGEKVDCRLILFPKDQEKIAMNKYGDLRSSDEAFDRMAREQASPTLAGKGGQIAPIGHKTTGNPELEREAFSLRPGEVSRFIETPQGAALLKCVKRIPPDTTKSLDKERPALEKEIIEKKTQLEIPNLVKELREQAQPKLFLQRATTQEELERAVRHELQGGAARPKPPAK